MTSSAGRVIDDLYRCHGDELFRYVRRRCGCAEVAADVVADVFEQACRAHSNGTSLTVGWLFTVAQRRLIDHWRRAARAAPANVVERDEHDPTERMEAAWLLRQLPERQRRALWLRYWGDLPISDVAERLDLSPAATESLLARARRSAREFAIASEAALTAA